jgi:hypothetical protein
MASIINASSTGSGGIVQTADASGVLQLQTNGTIALVVDTAAGVGINTGTNTLANKLEVVGSSRISEVYAQNGYEVAPASTTIITAYNRTTNTWLALRQRALQHEFYSNGSEVARISSAGYVTMPYQPMFSVYKGNANVTSSTGAGTQIVYNAVQVNVSSSYNTGNGYFTAPVAGTYYFSAMGMAATVGGSYDIQLQIQVNGTAIAISNPPASSGNAQGMGFACSCIATLALGDSVRVTYYSSTATVFYAGGGVFNNFSGFLVG